MEILIVIGVIVLFIVGGSIVNTYNQNEDLNKKITAFRSENEDLNKRITVFRNDLEEKKERLIHTKQENIELKRQVASQEKWIEEQHGIKKQILDEIEKYLLNSTALYKWLSPIIADIKLLAEDRLRDDADFVKNKRRSTDSSQLTVEALIKERKELSSDKHYLRYNLEYIKTFIPNIDDIIEDDGNYEALKKEDEPKKFISKDEYNRLSETEKNQRALDNYKRRRKSNWEIGRDYEMYIGYLCELDGWEVEYFGIEKKLEDLGRDLIAKKNKETLIIQCKRWAKNKVIHEKHIAQLFGTVVIYKFEHPKETNVTGMFITTAGLSEEAKKFARFLNIGIKENVKIDEYPMIKCHHGRGDEYGLRKKIYHLPMDQQYDNTIINKNHGDCYASSVKEAEEKGFERAYRWHSNWGDYS